jgi:hypothetical protein
MIAKGQGSGFETQLKHFQNMIKDMKTKNKAKVSSVECIEPGKRVWVLDFDETNLMKKRVWQGTVVAIEQNQKKSFVRRHGDQWSLSFSGFETRWAYGERQIYLTKAEAHKALLQQESRYRFECFFSSHARF